MAGDASNSAAASSPKTHARIKFEEEQLNNSSLNPNHAFAVIHPSLKHIDYYEEELGQFELLDIANASERYEPGTLIPSEAVAVHSKYRSDIRWLAAVHENDGVVDGSPNGFPFNGADFLIHTGFSKRKAGHTRLEVATVRSSNPKKPGLHLLIHCTAMYFRDDPNKEFRGALGFESHHQCSLEEFEAARKNKTQPSWWHIIDDLIYRRTDIAARHVAQRLDEWGIEDTRAHQWREPRLVDYRLAIRNAPEINTSYPAEDLICTICQEVPQDAVTLHNCQKHRFCRVCLSQWLISCKVEQAGCPNCRTTAVGPDQADEIIFGLHGKVYHADARFSDFENFERSCADLDVTLAENDKDGKITWSSNTLLQAWRLLIDGANLEPPESTPVFMQPARTPEFKTVERELLAYIMAAKSCPSWASGNMTVSEAYTVLVKQAKQLCLEEFERSGLSRFFEAQGFRSTSNMYPILLRPLKRRCNCGEEDWHYHGLRAFHGESQIERPRKRQRRLL